MKGFLELAGFIVVALAWIAADWLTRHAEAVLFTLGFGLIGIGCALIDGAMACIVCGSFICGLMVLGRLLAWIKTIRQPEDAGDV